MPVTDLSGDDDWLQQYLAGYAAVPGGGPATWAPYGGHPTNYGPPNPLGAGAPQPQPQPSALGYSLTSNPVTNWFKNHPMPTSQGVGGGYMGPYVGGPSPAAPATAPPAGAPGGGIGSDANFPVMAAGGFPTTYGAPGQQPPTPTGPVSGANPANRGVGTTRTPGAGAPAGNPSQTPQPGNSTRLPNQNRFVQVDRPNMPANAGGMARGGPPQMTALNLAGLFGGRGQQAANPANVPAANAQPVSGALAPGGTSNAPWGMGPLQPGMNWPGAMGPFTQDQLAARGLRQRYG